MLLCVMVLQIKSVRCEKMDNIEKVEIEAWKNSIVIKGRYVKPEVLSKIKEKFSNNLMRTVSFNCSKDKIFFDCEIFNL